MKKPRVYLDNCCYNRPYDNQSSEVIRFEAEAKLYVQTRIKDGKIELVWSFIVDFENSANPYEDRKESIADWKKFSTKFIKATEEIRKLAKTLESAHGLKPKDALHLACAIRSESGYFLTTDKQLLKKAASIKEIKVINPIEFIIAWEKK